MADDLKDIPEPPAPQSVLGPDQATIGPQIPPQQQIVLYSDKQWEGFVHEWAHFCLKKKYVQVQRFSGAGDKGIDVAGFTDANKLVGVWDNYQCKHYDHALYPKDAWLEIGKLLWFTFMKEFSVPRSYFFAAPRGVGTTLGKLLSNAPQLKAKLIEEWDKSCKSKITASQEVLLEGEFLAYVNAFDFTIFGAKTALELIEDHNLTPYHAARFGGGLPARPTPGSPPTKAATSNTCLAHTPTTPSARSRTRPDSRIGQN